MTPSDTETKGGQTGNGNGPAEDMGTLVITGGARGIGAACAILGAKRGYDIAISYLKDDQAAEAVVAACQKEGAHAIAVKGDVADERDVMTLFERAAKDLGPITAVINNAGIVAKQGTIDTFEFERMKRLLEVNVLGALLVAREAVRRMAKRNGGQGGAIVNVSSVAARLGGPGEYVDYAASKGAIDTLTIGMAKELAGEGVRVNAVRPGIIDTEIHALGGMPDRVERLRDSLPMRRAGTANEVAEPILWLLSDEASYMSGALVDIAGGR
jgi:NAD(P)-dependent dehydrogenase (short-subunit alcohol dehydrogenase family)